MRCIYIYIYIIDFPFLTLSLLSTGRRGLRPASFAKNNSMQTRPIVKARCSRGIVQSAASICATFGGLAMRKMPQKKTLVLLQGMEIGKFTCLGSCRASPNPLFV